MSERGLRGLLTLWFAVGTVFGAVQQAMHGVFSDERWAWAEMAVSVLVWSSGMVLAMWVVGKATASRHLPLSPAARDRRERHRHVAHALEAGRLPAGTDPRPWGRALGDEIRELKALWWLVVVYVTASAGLIAAAAVVANDNDWRVWAVAVLVAVEGLVAARWVAQRTSALQRLRATTDTQSQGA